MIRIAIVDDNTAFISSFKEMVSAQFDKYNIVYSIETFSDSMLFQDTCLVEEFQLIFLDIDMPQLSGIQIASMLRKYGKHSALVFVSAYENFVFESIHYKPFRFIRKDFIQDEIPEAVKAYCEELSEQQEYLEFDTESRGTIKIPVSEIVYFYSLRHDLYIYMNTMQSVRLAYRHYTIEELESRMSAFGFLRVERSYLLNFRYIYQIGCPKTTLVSEVSKKTHDEVPVSRRRYSSVRKQYQLLLREVDIL